MKSIKQRCALAIPIAVLAFTCAGQTLAGGPISPPKQPPIPAEWTKHENLESVVGADGKLHEASCSNLPGTNPAFHFWAKRGRANNLVVFFEGGGACWDSLSCSFPVQPGLPPQIPQFFVAQLQPGQAGSPANLNGIFNLEDPANPVRDWSFVYIPYCTGDIHLGSNDKTYVNVGSPTLPIAPGTPFVLRHRGFDNFMVVLDWVTKHFEGPHKILVTGSSAGGYGASGNFPWINEAYPRSHTYVIADASQGVTTEAFNGGNPGTGSWNRQLAPWVFGNNPDFAGPDLLRLGALYYPHTKVAQFTTNLDAVQIQFYGVQKQFYGPGGSCPNPAIDWNQQMLSNLGDYAEDVDNYRYYVAGGTYHTIMRGAQFYTESSAGIAYSKWVAGMLKSEGGSGGHGGKPWDDVACPGCLTALPCP